MSTVFPSRLDYETVIKRLDVFALDPGIRNGSVLMRKDGIFPQIYSGGRAVVFPVLIDGEKHAIKCWIQALGALEERYRFISRLIQESRPPYLVDSIYRESELLFNGARYPVLQMQWSESETLKEWISSNINNKSKLGKLASNFLDVTVDMHRLKMSHGDLQHENILVDSSCRITLVDYDSIYLPGLDHLDDEIKGLPGFQHSSRARQSKVNTKSDYLSEYVIYVSLMALSAEPDLWKDAKDHNRLLFSQEDIDNPKSSSIFAAIRSIKSLTAIVDAFESQCLCSKLDDITPLESVVPVINTSIPANKRAQPKSSPQQIDTQSQPRAINRASDLRNAKGWRSPREKAGESEWSFNGSTDKTSKKIEVDQKSSVSTSVNNTKPSSDHLKTISCPPRHTITGSLYGIDIGRSLLSVSFEKTTLRFRCQSLDGKTDSEVLLLKSKIKWWRRVNSTIEIYVASMYGSEDLIAVSSIDSTNLECIVEIAKTLDVFGIKLGSAPGSSQSNKHHPDAREFSYSSIQDVAYCTGKSSPEVEVVADLLHAKPPFSLVDADRIAGRLTGDPSIRRAYNRVRCSADPSKQRSSINYDIGESQAVSASPINPTTSSTPSEAGIGHGTPTNKDPEYGRKPGTTPSVTRDFSYSSFQDIAYCTGKSSVDVEAAARSAKARPPFTLIEADRIAGILVGDPSIRRAYERTKTSSKSPRSSSYVQQNSSDTQVVPTSQSKPSTASSSSDCFVATAIYGSPDHPDLSTLRLYRDKVLKTSSMGRVFIRFYYGVGPCIAVFIKRHSLSRPLRPLMSLLVRMITMRE